MIKHRQELNTLKESFMKKLSQYEEVSREQLQKEWSKIISNEKFLEEYLKISNDTDRDSTISSYFGKLENFNILQSALKLDPLCSYDFYDQFFAQFFKRQINKLKESGESLVYISNLSDLWEFTHRLANDMTLFQLSQVQYIPRILLFQKNKDVDWRDVYFNDEQEQGQIKKLFRKIMPIRQKYGIYSFNHKSLQEFLVAKWLIQSLDQFNVSLSLEHIDSQLDDLCVHNLSKDFMNGVVKFMVNKLSHNQYLQKKLLEILNLSKTKQKNDQIQEHDQIKVSQSIKIKRAQTQLLASQKVTQNLYSDEEVNQRLIQASSNSLYLLHLLKYPFKEDLNSIQIHDIELHNGNFFGSNLTYSEFSKVNISQCNFNFANLDYANWKDILIDELPSIETKLIPHQIFFYFHYIKSEDLLMFKAQSQTAWFDYKTQREVKQENQFEFINQDIKYILVSQNQSKIALFYDDSVTLISKIKSKIMLPEGFNFQTAYFTVKDELIIGSNKLIIKLKTDVKDQEIVITDTVNTQYFKQFNNNSILQIINSCNDKIQLNQLGFKKINQIASNQDYIMFLSDKKLIIVKEIEKKYSYFQFFFQCSHYECNNQLYDENEQEEDGPPQCLYLDSYNVVEISENQNLLLLGYQDEEQNIESSGILIIEKQHLTEKPHNINNNQESAKQIQYITSTKFIQLEIKRENKLKVYFVDDDKYILSFSHNDNYTYMRLWNFKEKKIISFNILDGQIKQMTKITSLLIATINQEGKIQIWDLCALLQQQKSYSISTITCCIFSINNNIISGNHQGIISIWDRQRGTKIGNDLQCHTASVQVIQFDQLYHHQ